MNLRKTVLALSVSACTGVAMAADKVPTLGDVLKASSIDINGYIDVSYTNFSSNTPMFQANTTEKNAFNLHAVDLVVSSLPASGFGGMVEMMGGADVAFNRARGWGSTDFDLLQAYSQYASGSLTAMAGKFTTLAGAEVAQAPLNANISRSLLYTNAIPVTHTGLRAVFVGGDTMKFTAGYNNGWDIMKESFTGNAAQGSNCKTATTVCADGKTLELGAALTPSKMFGLNASFYKGEEYSATSDAIGDRKLLDLVATINLTNQLTLVLNYDKGEQEKATATNGTAKWDGIAAYVNFAFTDKLRGSLRTESFKDKNCSRTTCAAGASSQTLKETTLTVAYAPVKSYELRAEYRKDKSNGDVFTESGDTKKTQSFFGLEAVYKF